MRPARARARTHCASLPWHFGPRCLCPPPAGVYPSKIEVFQNLYEPLADDDVGRAAKDEGVQEVPPVDAAERGMLGVDLDLRPGLERE